MNFPTHLPENLTELDALLELHEIDAAPLKEGAHARIIWHDDQRKSKTEYAIVYLHGFKSSQGEGFPVHQTIAQRFGCNLYLARLHDHGRVGGHHFKDLSPDDLLQSTIDACRIGERIGNKVIVIGTSTGGALGLWAAASPECPVDIEALVLYSPLIHLYGINSLLFENFIGRGILSLIPGKNHQLHSDPFRPQEDTIWYSSYCLNGALVLGKLIQKIMRRSTFANVTCPVFAGYYYQNCEQHDRVVSTSAIKRMKKMLGTPPENIVIKNFPNAGSHVICSSLLSNVVQEVTEKTTLYLRHVVGVPIFIK